MLELWTGALAPASNEQLEVVPWEQVQEDADDLTVGMNDRSLERREQQQRAPLN